MSTYTVEFERQIVQSGSLLVEADSPKEAREKAEQEVAARTDVNSMSFDWEMFVADLPYFEGVRDEDDVEVMDSLGREHCEACDDWHDVSLPCRKS